jgi:tRNA threonylcarbamoyladenosine biosynthesis protein TsaE
MMSLFMEPDDRLFDAPLERTCTSADEFDAVAAQLAVMLRPGEVVALSGPLGAGKTTFARAIVRALHDRDEGSSPTFTFRHRYDGDPPIEHLDFYRIDAAPQALELGLEDAFAKDAVVIVEWWRNAPFLLPRRRWEIDIEGAGDEPRRVRIVAPKP